MKRKYANPFVDSRVISYYHKLGDKDSHKQERYALYVATGLISFGCTLMLIVLSWCLI